MNLLDLVPTFKRHIGVYLAEEDTDSRLTGYLADGIEALSFRWSRTYVVTQVGPESFSVTPDIASKDKRPIILMSSIIYKLASLQLASFTDQDFSYDPQQGRQNPIQLDIEELARFLPIYRLAKPATAPMRGFNNVYNPESYQYMDWLNTIWP
jgi:hypothetical protein